MATKKKTQKTQVQLARELNDDQRREALQNYLNRMQDAFGLDRTAMTLCVGRRTNTSTWTIRQWLSKPTPARKQAPASIPSTTLDLLQVEEVILTSPEAHRVFSEDFLNTLFEAYDLK